jgi:hypothetical protein
MTCRRLIHGCRRITVALIGDYTATAILLNVADQHVRPRDTSLLSIRVHWYFGAAET